MINLGENKWDNYYYALENVEPYNADQISKRLLDNKEFVMRIRLKCTSLFAYISERLKNDEEVVMQLIGYRSYYDYETRWQIDALIDCFKKNSAALFLFIQNEGEKSALFNLINDVNNELLQDENFINKYKDNERFYISVLKNNITDNDDLIFELFKNNKLFQNNKTIIKETIKTSKFYNSRVSILQYTSPEMQNDKELFMFIVDNGLHASQYVLEYASDELKDDEELVLKILNKLKHFKGEYNYALSLASRRLQKKFSKQ